jgi:hypothetical protein
MHLADSQAQALALDHDSVELPQWWWPEAVLPISEDDSLGHGRRSRRKWDARPAVMRP